ncbi:MAG: hypothetical protein MR051_06750 [Lentisphaeria bacterium]|nr:hypothetical protein [Lentisphaeria bacterium]
MKKFLLILTLCAVIPVRSEPVTMVLLAPVALKVAKDASPHVISGMRGAGDQMLAVAQDLGNILLLPWGVVQATAGLPFGYMDDGFGNIFAGVCAPFQLVMDVLMLPVAFTGNSNL